MKYILLTISLAGLAIASPTAQLAPLSKRGEVIDDSYIVVLKKDVNPQQMALHLAGLEEWHSADPVFNFASGIGSEVAPTGGVKNVYMPTHSGHGYFGYAGIFSANTLHSIRSAPEVAYVEHDQIMRTLEIPQGVDDYSEMGKDTGITTELGAPWGLARISHRAKLTLGTFTKYLYESSGGEGVTAYVIDTGINVDHVEFEGRARWGKTMPKNDVDKDGNGHGTHCAGTIASKKYGVAKKAEVVAVKVLGSNGSGSMSDVVDGVVWAADQASKAQVEADKEFAATGKTKHKGSVANMSLGGGKAQALDDAVNAAVEAGLHFAVAAGNDNKDACAYSPASAELAVTVGASTLGDERAYFSNHGKCVDIFAPGLNILSTWTGGNETSNTISGTSMASPHICGLLAYLLSIEGTETFSILTGDAAEVESESTVSLYGKALSLLPKLAQSVLPAASTQDQDEFRPTPKKGEVTPAKLKKALIALSSAGKITEGKAGTSLPAGTPNLLAFNNATQPAKK